MIELLHRRKLLTVAGLRPVIVVVVLELRSLMVVVVVTVAALADRMVQQRLEEIFDVVRRCRRRHREGEHSGNQSCCADDHDRLLEMA